MLSDIGADFLVFVWDFNNLISSRPANGLTVWQPPCWSDSSWFECACVLTAHMWVLPMSQWIPFEPFSTQKRSKKSIRCSTSRCGLITLTDSSANQQRAHRNAHVCILTNGVNRNCLQMSKLIDMSINISAAEMSQLMGKIWKKHLLCFFQTSRVR